VVLYVFNEVVLRVFILLHETKEINIHAAVLAHGQQCVEVFLVHVLLIQGCVDQCHVDIKVICELGEPDELHQLLAEVVHALRGHHEVVLHGDSKALSHSVAVWPCHFDRGTSFWKR